MQVDAKPHTAFPDTDTDHRHPESDVEGFRTARLPLLLPLSAANGTKAALSLCPWTRAHDAKLRDWKTTRLAERLQGRHRRRPLRQSEFLN